VTKKAAEVPMGGGKGSPEYYAISIQRGVIVFEMDGVSEAVAREALRRAGHKLPVKTRVVFRHGRES